MTAVAILVDAALLEAVPEAISRSQGPVDEIDLHDYGGHTTSMIPTFDIHNENVFYLLPAEIYHSGLRAITHCFISPRYISCNEICNIGM